MNKVILDTSFILSCIREKIDFFEDIKFRGLKIIIPKQVIEEIERVSNSKKKLHFREEAKLALVMLNNNDFEKIDLKKRYVDKGLIDFANENPSAIVATLDKEIKKNTKNLNLVIRGKKKLELV